MTAELADLPAVAAEEAHCSCGALSAQRHGVWLARCEGALMQPEYCKHDSQHETESVCLDCGSPLCEGCNGTRVVYAEGMRDHVQGVAHECPTCGGTGVAA